MAAAGKSQPMRAVLVVVTWLITTTSSMAQDPAPRLADYARAASGEVFLLLSSPGDEGELIAKLRQGHNEYTPFNHKAIRKLAKDLKISNLRNGRLAVVGQDRLVYVGLAVDESRLSSKVVVAELDFDGLLREHWITNVPFEFAKVEVKSVNSKAVVYVNYWYGNQIRKDGRKIPSSEFLKMGVEIFQFGKELQPITVGAEKSSHIKIPFHTLGVEPMGLLYEDLLVTKSHIYVTAQRVDSSGKRPRLSFITFQINTRSGQTKALKPLTYEIRQLSGTSEEPSFRMVDSETAYIFRGSAVARTARLYKLVKGKWQGTGSETLFDGGGDLDLKVEPTGFVEAAASVGPAELYFELFKFGAEGESISIARWRNARWRGYCDGASDQF